MTTKEDTGGKVTSKEMGIKLIVKKFHCEVIRLLKPEGEYKEAKKC